jgi:pyruvate dehydrogenase kinase 2/3/4
MTNFPYLYNKIFDYGLKRVSHLNFADMLKMIHMKNSNRIKLTSTYIYNEVPIRLAQRVKDLNELPYGLSKNHSVNKVREWYLQSFMDIVEHPMPIAIDDMYKFKETIEKIHDRHAPTLTTMSKGIYELKKEGLINDINSPTIQTFLNRFYTNRTELRILIEQYLSFFVEPCKTNCYNKNRGLSYTNENNEFGTINLECNLIDIINKSIHDVQYICNKNLLDVDTMNIITTNINNVDINNVNINNVNIHQGKCNKVITLPSLEPYLYFIFFEIIKNSVKAVIEKRDVMGERGGNMMGESKIYEPSIKISINTISSTDIIVKIDDNGIGIKSDDIHKIWYYSFSTSPIDMAKIIEEKDFNITPLSGFGYGLPIADIYMNFLNNSTNNIKINSIYKEGTSVIIFLKKYDYLYQMP